MSRRMMPRTLVVAGNGLTLDLMNEFGGTALLSTRHPSRPLDWDLAIPDGRRLETVLPEFYAELQAVRSAQPDASHFDLMDAVWKAADQRQRAAHETRDMEALNKAALVDSQLRHFLALAYSDLDRELLTQCPVEHWPWTDFFRLLGHQLLAVVSFNYETGVERALAAAGIAFYRCGVEPPSGIPLGKPHGSIDYELAPNIIKTPEPPDYPMEIVTSLMNTPVRLLTAAERMQPRRHVEVVPPLQASQIRNFQWVAPIFDFLAAVGHAVELCIFAGFSASPVDQPELCDILRRLSPATEIVVANPDPRASCRIEFHTRRLGLRPVVRWPNGPE
jgi:hypothetical protein